MFDGAPTKKNKDDDDVDALEKIILRKMEASAVLQQQSHTHKTCSDDDDKHGSQQKKEKIMRQKKTHRTLIRAKIHTRKKALWIALYRRRRFVLRSLAFSILCLGIDCSKSSDLWLTMRTANVMIMTTFNVRRYFFALCLSLVRLCVCFFFVVCLFFARWNSSARYCGIWW